MDTRKSHTKIYSTASDTCTQHNGICRVCNGLNIGFLCSTGDTTHPPSICVEFVVYGQSRWMRACACVRLVCDSFVKFTWWRCCCVNKNTRCRLILRPTHTTRWEYWCGTRLCHIHTANRTENTRRSVFVTFIRIVSSCPMRKLRREKYCCLFMVVVSVSYVEGKCVNVDQTNTISAFRTTENVLQIMN